MNITPAETEENDIATTSNEAIEQEDTFSNYKKFSSTFTILPGVKEVPSDEKQK